MLKIYLYILMYVLCASYSFYWFWLCFSLLLRHESPSAIPLIAYTHCTAHTAAFFRKKFCLFIWNALGCYCYRWCWVFLTNSLLETSIRLWSFAFWCTYTKWNAHTLFVIRWCHIYPGICWKCFQRRLLYRRCLRMYVCVYECISLFVCMYE